MFKRTGPQFKRIDWYLRRLGGALLIVAGLSQAAIANTDSDSSVGTPVRLDLEDQLEWSITADLSGHDIGDRTEHLPAATPKATRIVLRLGERRVYVYDNDQILDSYPVAIGAPSTPTPTGQFEIFQMIVDPVWQSPWTGEIFPPGANSALGLRWIGFAEMPSGIIGFHGTPTVSSIGKAASNGCVRLTNEDVLALYEHVRIGMTVTVEP